MVVLAVSTSTDQGSVAVGDTPSGFLSKVLWRKSQQHGEMIVSAVDQCLNMAGVEKQNITHIAVDIGPGSFTGARVATNFAKTLAYGLGIPVLTFSSLELINLRFKSLNTNLSSVALIDAHKQLYFFSDSKAPAEATLIDEEGLYSRVNGPHMFLGRLNDDQWLALEKKYGGNFQRPTSSMPDDLDYPSTRFMLELALRKSRTETPWTNIEPLYIRPPEA